MNHENCNIIGCSCKDTNYDYQEYSENEWEQLVNSINSESEYECHMCVDDDKRCVIYDSNIVFNYPLNMCLIKIETIHKLNYELSVSVENLKIPKLQYCTGITCEVPITVDSMPLLEWIDCDEMELVSYVPGSTFPSM